MNRHWYIAFQTISGNVVSSGFYVYEGDKPHTYDIIVTLNKVYCVSSALITTMFEISTDDYNKYPDYCKINIE